MHEELWVNMDNHSEHYVEIIDSLNNKKQQCGTFAPEGVDLQEAMSCSCYVLHLASFDNLQVRYENSKLM